MAKLSIHIVTSAKGGMGKSSACLAIANHCIQNNRRFVLIDTNPQNSNIAEDLFFYFHAEHTKKIPAKFGLNETVYTLHPGTEESFKVINATNNNPFKVVQYIQNNFPNDDTTYIIDTNVHIRSCPKDIVTTKTNHQIYVWFMWGWSSPRLDHQLQSILTATKNIEKHWPTAQVIHVFNLYDFFSNTTKLFSIRKASTTLRPLKNILKKIDKRIKQFNGNKIKAVYVDIDFMNPLMSKLHNTLIRYVAPDNLAMEELPILWATELTKIIDSSKNSYPCNILLIPTFFKELTMSVDRIVMGAPRTFEKIIEMIRPMAQFIDVFLSCLDNCVDITRLSEIADFQID